MYVESQVSLGRSRLCQKGRKEWGREVREVSSRQSMHTLQWQAREIGLYHRGEYFSICKIEREYSFNCKILP